jgi:hypothetical protein
MIFDRFPTRDHASAFARHVAATYDLNVRVFDSAREAAEADYFPFELTAPVVLVDRSDELEERPIEESVLAYGGTFAGT